MKDKPETLIQPTMGIKWNSGSLLDMEGHMPSATQNNSKKNKKKQPGKDTHTHTNYIYIYILLCMSAQEHVTSTTRGELQNFAIWHTSGCLMVDVPYLDHLCDRQKDFLDVGQVRFFHEETSRKLLFWKEDTKESDRIPAKKSLV